MKNLFPKAVKVCLWSYDTDKMELSNSTDRHRIILNILIHGAMEAIEWLWQNFSTKEIKETIKKSYESEWDKPSLNLWSLVYEVKPERKNRFGITYGNPLEHSK